MQATHVLAACQKGVQLRPGHSIFAEQHLRCLWQAFNSCKQIWQVIPPKLLITRSALVWKPRLLHRRKVPRAGLPHLAVRELFGVLRAARHCGGQSPSAQLPLQRALVARRLRWPDPGTEKEATWTLAISEEEVSEKEQTELRKSGSSSSSSTSSSGSVSKCPTPPVPGAGRELQTMHRGCSRWSGGWTCGHGISALAFRKRLDCSGGWKSMRLEQKP